MCFCFLYLLRSLIRCLLLKLIKFQHDVLSLPMLHIKCPLLTSYSHETYLKSPLYKISFTTVPGTMHLTRDVSLI